MIWSMALNRAENWTLKTDIKNSECAFEMWLSRPIHIEKNGEDQLDRKNCKHIGLEIWKTAGQLYIRRNTNWKEHVMKGNIYFI